MYLCGPLENVKKSFVIDNTVTFIVISVHVLHPTTKCTIPSSAFLSGLFLKRFIPRQCLNKRSSFLKRVGSVEGEETLALQPSVSVFWLGVFVSPIFRWKFFFSLLFHSVNKEIGDLFSSGHYAKQWTYHREQEGQGFPLLRGE